MKKQQQIVSPRKKNKTAVETQYFAPFKILRLKLEQQHNGMHFHTGSWERGGNWSKERAKRRGRPTCLPVICPPSAVKIHAQLSRFSLLPYSGHATMHRSINH